MEAFIDRIFFASGGHVDGAKYYFRIVRRSDGQIWNQSSNTFAIDTSWSNSAVVMEETGTTGQFPVIIPKDFTPGGTYYLVVYVQAGSFPANTDNVEEQYESKIGSVFGF